MSVEQPIFIVGAGRSGSTVFHKMFAWHPQVSWLSRLCDKYPDKPSVNRCLMNALDYPVIGNYLQEKTYPEECYKFWGRYCKGFNTPCRDLLREDVTEKTKRAVKDVMAKMLTSKRNRLLVKVTGWPRVAFLKEIFHDAKFIHIIRDGRAVANSFINMDWWWGWRGPDNWRWGALTSVQNKEWERHKRSFIALACIEWKILMDAMEGAKNVVPSENFLEIKYEDLCSDPLDVFKETIKFCSLEQSTGFEDFVGNYSLKNINDKWKTELTGDQAKIMEDVLGDYLGKYGYV